MNSSTSDPNARSGRSSPRVDKFIPVQLEWIDVNGENVSAPARTRALNVYGCLVVSPQDFNFGQRLRLVNLSNQRALEGQVVWKGNHGRDGWELGVELIHPVMDYWGPSA